MFRINVSGEETDTIDELMGDGLNGEVHPRVGCIPCRPEVDRDSRARVEESVDRRQFYVGRRWLPTKRRIGRFDCQLRISTNAQPSLRTKSLAATKYRRYADETPNDSLADRDQILACETMVSCHR